MIFREVIYYRNYFQSFYSKQNPKVKAKILWTITVIEEIEHVTEIYLKHLTGTEGLYELRVKFGSDIFRIFCFFDEGKLVY